MRDLVEDIWQDKEVLDKIKTSKSYAQNVYAAMCNMRWCPRDLIPALRQDENRDLWSASWRAAGGIVADFRRSVASEDYMTYYCSSMGGLLAVEEDEQDHVNTIFAESKFVSEGTVTDEVEQDFNRLGWFPVPWGKDSD